MKKRLNKKGFTLIELIVVIAILGILAAIAIPRLSGFTERAKESSDEQFGALVGHAASALYATDQDLTAPDLEVEDLVAEDMLDAAQCKLSSAKYGGAGSLPADVSSDNNTAVVVAITDGNITVTMNSVSVYPAH